MSLSCLAIFRRLQFSNAGLLRDIHVRLTAGVLPLPCSNCISMTWRVYLMVFMDKGSLLTKHFIPCTVRLSSSPDLSPMDWQVWRMMM